MIPIKYYDKDNPVLQKEVVKAYCEELLERRNKISALDKWCEKYDHGVGKPVFGA